MRLPKNLLDNNYTKPRLFLCETDKEKICQLDVSGLSGSFKLNSYSELSFEVGRVYNDLITGETKVNPFYDKIEALRLVYLENFGYFELQNPELVGDGIKESKTLSAYSLEYTLSQKYLSDFYINTGEVNSVEVIYAEEVYGERANDHISPVTLYNPSNKRLSLLHLILEKVYGWSIGHVDSSLEKLSRQFEVDRESVYDFLMNEICEKFNCYVVFDTIDNTINLYAESLTSKFIGDGEKNTFIISPPFAKIGTVSVDGYKTTRWTYDMTKGELVLEDTPEAGAHIEVVDGALEQWETDVFVTFDNLSQEVKINYDADSIKTVLTVTYGEDGDIRETNLGLPYLTDLSYYYTVDWMGQDLYDAYTAYLQKTNKCQSIYTNNSQEMLKLTDQIWFEENRLSLEYSIAQSVGSETVGTYYVRGGTAPNYYYTEVSLPADYNANTTYYSLDTANLNETKVNNLYTVLKKYFNNENEDDNSGGTPITSWKTELNNLSADFEFMENYTLNYLSTELSKVDSNRTRNGAVEEAIKNFLAEMWSEIGKTPLKMLYYEPYKKVQITNMEVGWSQEKDANYPYYYPVVLLLNSIEAAISERDRAINEYQKQYNTLSLANANISNDLLMNNNFTPGQLVRLSAFLREDELQLDDIIETDQDSIADSFKIKQDAMEAGRIELNKICQPQLQFSMSMANIYALPEFEPIIDQFQLGNVIKVGLRPDYIKQSRLLQVDINFEDFSDFSCEFGELTNLRSQSDIHADLLSKAITAGKSVATNASYWSKGSNKANSIDLRLQEGLLNSIEALKAMDGTQNAYMDKYGIHLEVVNPSTGETGDKRVWLCNNQIVFTDDGFKTSKAALGECPILAIDRETGDPIIDSETGEKKYEPGWGLLAQAVIAGYIEGSRIRGGTIQIGEQTDGSYAFEVREDGSVVMNGGSQIAGYVKEENETIVSDTIPATAKDGQLWINTSTTPYTIMTCEHTKYLNFDGTAAPDDVDIIYITDSQSNLATQFISQIGEDTSASFDADGNVITTNSSASFGAGAWMVDDEGHNIGSNVVTIFLGKNVIKLQGGCFTGCPNLKTIYVNNGKWVSKQGNVYTSKPEQYYPGDLWILADGESYGSYQHGSILKADENLEWVDAVSNITNTISNVNQYFEFNSDSGLKIGQKNEKFHVSINSTRMGFYDGDTEVVHISNQSANIDDLTVEKKFVADCNVSSFNGDIAMNKTSGSNEYSFSWRIEDNGSFSLVKN